MLAPPLVGRRLENRRVGRRRFLRLQRRLRLRVLLPTHPARHDPSPLDPVAGAARAGGEGHGGARGVVRARPPRGATSSRSRSRWRAPPCGPCSRRTRTRRSGRSAGSPRRWRSPRWRPRPRSWPPPSGFRRPTGACSGCGSRTPCSTRSRRWRLLEFVVPYPFGPVWRLDAWELWGGPVHHYRGMGLFGTLYLGALPVIAVACLWRERRPGLRFARALLLLAARRRRSCPTLHPGVLGIVAFASAAAQSREVRGGSGSRPLDLRRVGLRRPLATRAAARDPGRGGRVDRPRGGRRARDPRRRAGSPSL